MWQHPLGAVFFVFIFLKFFHIVNGSDLRDCTNDSLIIISSVWGLRAVRFRRGVKPDSVLKESVKAWELCVFVGESNGDIQTYAGCSAWELCVFVGESNHIFLMFKFESCAFLQRSQTWCFDRTFSWVLCVCVELLRLPALCLRAFRVWELCVS